MGEKLPELNYEADPRLVAEGWERRFMADNQRASEVIDIYTSLGYEVRAESVSPSDLRDECVDCQLIACHTYVTIYTRKRAEE